MSPPSQVVPVAAFPERPLSKIVSAELCDHFRCLALREQALHLSSLLHGLDRDAVDQCLGTGFVEQCGLFQRGGFLLVGDLLQLGERDEGLIKLNPILPWYEREIWQYLSLYDVPVNPLYKLGYRSLGCGPCTSCVESTAKNVAEVVEEIRSGKFANIAERSGRAQDKDDGGGLETLRRDGYM